MSDEQMWATFRVFDAIRKVDHTAKRDRGVVELVIRDAKHGNTVVREVAAVPTPEEAAKILADMDAEIKRRAAGAKKRIKAEREVNAE